MPILEHPTFDMPKSGRAQTWRYMPFVQLISVIQTSKLHFERLDKLQDDDPFEGILTQPMVDRIMRSLPSPEALERCDPDIVAKAQDPLLPVRFFLKTVFVNCWYLGKEESAAMWPIYGDQECGVCIRSTIGRMKSAFAESDADLYMGRVKYIDHHRDEFHIDTGLVPGTYKRRCFRHENELRLLAHSVTAIGKGHVQEIRFHDGLELPVDLSALIQKIIVGPKAPSWVVEVVAQAAREAGITAPVDRSTLLDRPHWFPANGPGW